MENNRLPNPKYDVCRGCPELRPENFDEQGGLINHKAIYPLCFRCIVNQEPVLYSSNGHGPEDLSPAEIHGVGARIFQARSLQG
jgi:hypothetical protein